MPSNFMRNSIKNIISPGSMNPDPKMDPDPDPAKKGQIHGSRSTALIFRVGSINTL